MPQRGFPVDGEKIIRLRRRKLWTRREFELHTDVHYDTLSTAEIRNGPLSAESIHKIADALDVDSSEIVIFEEASASILAFFGKNPRIEGHYGETEERRCRRHRVGRTTGRS